MSTQFRSRIKTVAFYGEEESSQGGCCLPDGTKISATVSECNKQGGYFQLGELDTIQCPDRGLTGTCCACSYIKEHDGNFDTFLDALDSGEAGYNTYYLQSGQGILDQDLNPKRFGIKENASQCECNRYGGNWFYGPLSEITQLKNLCNDYGTDVRVPGSCCHRTTNSDEDLCVNICTSLECGNLATPDYTPQYGGTRENDTHTLCGRVYNGNDPASCETGDGSDGGQQEQQRLPREDVVGSCYEISITNNIFKHTCSRKTESDCDKVNGFWPDQSLSCDGSNGGLYPPTKSSGSLIVDPPSVSSDTITTPNIGEEYQGGIYIGTFEPGQSQISYRNERTNSLTSDTARDYGYGQQSGKWAIILDPRFYGDPSDVTLLSERTSYRAMEPSDKKKAYPTSYYDGFYNTYGNNKDYLGPRSQLYNDIRSLTTKGFNDWYIPSIDELSFIHKNLSKTVLYDKVNATERASKIILPGYFGTNIMSSTFYSSKDKSDQESSILGRQIIGNKSYLWGQNFAYDANINNYGLRFYIDRTTPLSVPLVRRILIT